MSQSLAQIYVHLVFSTKNRARLLPTTLHDDLHAYMVGILRDLECPGIEINNEPDHAHVLFTLSRSKTISDVVGQLKKGSTLWLQRQQPSLRDFHWQNGYGAFSVSKSNIEDVREYIRRQHEHHQRQTFQDEFLAPAVVARLGLRSALRLGLNGKLRRPFRAARRWDSKPRVSRGAQPWAGFLGPFRPLGRRATLDTACLRVNTRRKFRLRRMPWPSEKRAVFFAADDRVGECIDWGKLIDIAKAA